jgi:hypothetical protein
VGNATGAFNLKQLLQSRSICFALRAHRMAAQSGIGIKLSAADSNLRIDGVMDRGPAFNAGIRAGWCIGYRVHMVCMAAAGFYASVLSHFVHHFQVSRVY